MIKILRYGQAKEEDIFRRPVSKDDVAGTVREIIRTVREKGDEALRSYAEKFDHTVLSHLEVTREEREQALQQTDPSLLEVIRKAAKRIESFHRRQIRNSFVIHDEDGIVLGQKIMPIERVGLYVPGGTAAYPSTVLMDAIPAIIAGCSEVIMTSPPGRDGKIHPEILAAAEIIGIGRIYKVGGAQSIAAMAYGTETIPKTDKIVGPGNAYVAEAKRQVYGQVSIDMIAGPSEILIIADAGCDERELAADLLSQAEHDRLASAVLVTDSQQLAERTSNEIERQLADLPRKEIAGCSIDQNGKIIVTDDLDEAIELANKLAPEHLELCVDHPFDYLSRIRNAGSVFLGKNCPEALGDYFAGPNHTLPTSGTARFFSPLSVDDFIKKTQFTYYTREALAAVAKDIEKFAMSEGLAGHARSAVVRTEDR